MTNQQPWCLLIADWRGTGCPPEGADWKDQALIGTSGQRNEHFWLRKQQPRFWKPWISGLPQRRQQMKVDLYLFKGQHVCALLNSTWLFVLPPRWQNWTTSSATFFSLRSSNWGVITCNESFCLKLEEGGTEEPLKASIKRQCLDSFPPCHFLFFGMKQINQEILVKMGTLVCLNRNPSCSYDTQGVCYMEGHCGMWTADSPVVLSCFVLFIFFNNWNFVVFILISECENYCMGYHWGLFFLVFFRSYFHVVLMHTV